MARFDVYVGAPGRGYLLDCQCDLLDHLDTRAVVPLLPTVGTPQVSRLNPVFSVADTAVVMTTHLIFAMPRNALRTRVASLREEADQIMNALDVLFTGV